MIKILSICFLTPLIFSASALTAEETKYGLFLSPNLCLLSEKQNECEIKIHLKWYTNTPSEYCIHTSPTDKPLRCWSNTNQSEMQLELKLDDNQTLYLVDALSSQVVYQQAIRIQKQTTAYRQKRRNPWRFY